MYSYFSYYLIYYTYIHKYVSFPEHNAQVVSIHLEPRTADDDGDAIRAYMSRKHQRLTASARGGGGSLKGEDECIVY